MTIAVYRNGIAMRGKISEVLACLRAVPGDMLLREYILSNLH